MSLLELTQQLSKTFDACLESILTEPLQKEENAENIDTHINKLKISFLNIESQIKEIRATALTSKDLSLRESNRLLRKDIEIKKNTINKYVTKLENWEKELPILKENSKKALSIRTDGYDFDSDIPVLETPIATEDELIGEQTTELQNYTQTTNREIETTTENNTVNNTESSNTVAMDEDDDDDDDDVEFEEV